MDFKRYSELFHYGVKGMRWGVRRYQNKDGSLTPLGKRHYLDQNSVREAFRTEKGVQKVVDSFSKEDRAKFGFDDDKEKYSTKAQAEATVKRFIKTHDKKITAFMDIYWEETGNYGIAVGTHKDHRGKGYQKQLMKKAKKWVEKHIDQIDAKYLDWLARPDNKSSIALAEQAGFKRDLKYNDGHKDSWNLYRYDLDQLLKKKR